MRVQEFGSALADAKFQSVLGFGKLFLGLLLQSNVADGAENQDPVLAFERAETDFHGEFRAVLAAAKKLHAGAHHAQAGSFGELVAMPLMVPAKAIGHKVFHGAAKKFFALVAEELFGLCVDERN